ncbi:MAG TPA: hypothetical protein VM600_01490, partial [Actinomycetota bacterium]|nr:hypothetical protein [Actinomycetota bacterium]
MQPNTRFVPERFGPAAPGDWMAAQRGAPDAAEVDAAARAARSIREASASAHPSIASAPWTFAGPANVG